MYRLPGALISALLTMVNAETLSNAPCRSIYVTIWDDGTPPPETYVFSSETYSIFRPPYTQPSPDSGMTIEPQNPTVGPPGPDGGVSAQASQATITYNPNVWSPTAPVHHPALPTLPVNSFSAQAPSPTPYMTVPYPLANRTSTWTPPGQPTPTNIPPAISEINSNVYIPPAGSTLIAQNPTPSSEHTIINPPPFLSNGNPSPSGTPTQVSQTTLPITVSLNTFQQASSVALLPADLTSPIPPLNPSPTMLILDPTTSVILPTATFVLEYGTTDGTFIEQGCYQDSSNNGYPLINAFNAGPIGDVTACLNTCSTGSYTYAGVEGGTCWCANAMDVAPPITDGSCNTPCQNDPSQYCAGKRKRTPMPGGHIIIYRLIPALKSSSKGNPVLAPGTTYQQQPAGFTTLVKGYLSVNVFSSTAYQLPATSVMPDEYPMSSNPISNMGQQTVGTSAIRVWDPFPSRPVLSTAQQAMETSVAWAQNPPSSIPGSSIEQQLPVTSVMPIGEPIPTSPISEMVQEATRTFTVLIENMLPSVTVSSPSQQIARTTTIPAIRGPFPSDPGSSMEQPLARTSAVPIGESIPSSPLSNLVSEAMRTSAIFIQDSSHRIAASSGVQQMVGTSTIHVRDPFPVPSMQKISETSAVLTQDPFPANSGSRTAKQVLESSSTRYIPTSSAQPFQDFSPSIPASSAAYQVSESAAMTIQDLSLISVSSTMQGLSTGSANVFQNVFPSNTPLDKILTTTSIGGSYPETSTSPSPLPGLIISPDGSCGGSAGYTCLGLTGGANCCSKFGFCGAGPDYCDGGCQPEYGVCPVRVQLSSSVVGDAIHLSTMQPLFSYSALMPGILQLTLTMPSLLVTSSVLDQILPIATPQPQISSQFDYISMIPTLDVTSNAPVVSVLLSSMTPTILPPLVPSSILNQVVPMATSIHVSSQAAFASLGAAPTSDSPFSGFIVSASVSNVAPSMLPPVATSSTFNQATSVVAAISRIYVSSQAAFASAPLTPTLDSTSDAPAASTLIFSKGVLARELSSTSVYDQRSIPSLETSFPVASSMAQVSSVPTSVPLISSTNGLCGNGITCLGWPLGECCSQYGNCGNAEPWCGLGCQPEFGVCNEDVISSSGPNFQGAVPTSSLVALPLPSATISQALEAQATSPLPDRFRSTPISPISALPSILVSDYLMMPSSMSLLSEFVQLNAPTTSAPEDPKPTSLNAIPTSSPLIPTDNGLCGNGITCLGWPLGQCCSQYSSCGNTKDYCGFGCQSEYGLCDMPSIPSSAIFPPAPITSLGLVATSSPLTPTNDGYCGNGITCLGWSLGQCCSQYSSCGRTEDYCGIGCQSEFGICDLHSSVTLLPAPTTSILMPLATSLVIPPTILLATFFSDSDCGGQPFEAYGNYDLCQNAPDSFSNEASSMTFASAASCTLFGDYDCSGNSVTYTIGDGEQSFFETFNDRMVSFKCEAPTPASQISSSIVDVSLPSSTQVASIVPTLLSTDGRCGNDHNDFTCLGYHDYPGGPDLFCCSQFGWCGVGSDWCGAGCQHEFGLCNDPLPIPPPSSILVIPSATPSILPTCTPLATFYSDDDFGGGALDACGDFGVCQNVPDGWQNSASSMIFAEAGSCTLYAGSDCSSDSVTYTNGDGQESAFSFNDRMVSYTCLAPLLLATFFSENTGTGNIWNAYGEPSLCVTAPDAFQTTASSMVFGPGIGNCRLYSMVDCSGQSWQFVNGDDQESSLSSFDNQMSSILCMEPTPGNALMAMFYSDPVFSGLAYPAYGQFDLCQNVDQSTNFQRTASSIIFKAAGRCTIWDGLDCSGNSIQLSQGDGKVLSAFPSWADSMLSYACSAPIFLATFYTNNYFSGNSLDAYGEFGVCQNAPEDFQNDASSMKFEFAQRCDLYNTQDCSGSSVRYLIDDGNESAFPGFNDQMVSFMCFPNNPFVTFYMGSGETGLSFGGVGDYDTCYNAPYEGTVTSIRLWSAQACTIYWLPGCGLSEDSATVLTSNGVAQEIEWGRLSSYKCTATPPLLPASVFTDPGYNGSGYDVYGQVNECINVPRSFQSTVTSISWGAVGSCTLYDALGCNGHPYTYLSDDPHDAYSLLAFNDQMQSLQCTDTSYCSPTSPINDYHNNPWTMIYMGAGYTEDPNSPANVNAESNPPITNTYGTNDLAVVRGQACLTLADCMDWAYITNGGFWNLDLHLIRDGSTTGHWECVAYYEKAGEGWFTVQNESVLMAYGYDFVGDSHSLG